MISKKQSEVYVWGSDQTGQLGLPTTNNKNYNIPKLLIIPLQIRALSCGEKHIAILNSQGEVFTQGCNTDGKLGINSKTTKFSNTPIKVQLPSTVIKLQCGLSHTLVLLQSGQIYAWGLGEYGALGIGQFKTKWKPTKVMMQQGIKIKAIGGGAMHSVFVSLKGELFTCGSNDYGELGNNRKEKIAIPSLVSFNQKIIDIACGNFYTLLLTENGNIFAMGNNKYGQLGIGSKGAQSYPILVKSLQNEKIVKISAGYHSGALTNKGELYLWGSSTFGEFLKPIKVKKGITFIDFCIGGFFGIAIDNRNGVYSWGNNNYGQLGLGHYDSIKEPTEIVDLRNKNIQRVFCGINFVYAMSYPDHNLRSSIAQQRLEQPIVQSVIDASNRNIQDRNIKELKRAIHQFQKNEKELLIERSELQTQLQQLSRDYEKLSNKYQMIQTIIKQKQKIIGIYESKLKQFARGGQQQFRNQQDQISIIIQQNKKLHEAMQLKEQTLFRYQKLEEELMREIAFLKDQLKQSSNLLKEQKQQQRHIQLNTKHIERQLTQKYQSILKQKDQQASQLNSRLANESRKWNLQARRKDENLKLLSNKIEIIMKQKDQQEKQFAKRINKLQALLKSKDSEITTLNSEIAQINVNSTVAKQEQKTLIINKFKQTEKELNSKYQTLLKQKDAEIVEINNQNSILSNELKKYTMQSRRKDQSTKNTLTKYESLLKEKDEEIKNLTQKFNKIENFLKDEEKNSSNRFNRLQEDLKLHQENQNSLNLKINRMETQMRARDQQLKNLNSKLVKSESYVKSISQERDTLQSRIQKLEILIKESQQDNSLLSQKLVKLESQLVGESSKIYQTQTRIQQTFQSEKNALVAKFKMDQKQIIDTYENYMRQKESKIQGLSEQIEELMRNQNTKIANNSKYINQLLEQKQLEYNNVLDKVKHLENQIKNKDDSKNSEKQLLIAKYQSLLSNKDAEINELMKLTTTHHQQLQLSQRMSREQEMKELHAVIAALREKISQQQQLLSQMRILKRMEAEESRKNNFIPSNIATITPNNKQALLVNRYETLLKDKQDQADEYKRLYENLSKRRKDESLIMALRDEENDNNLPLKFLEQQIIQLKRRNRILNDQNQELKLLQEEFYDQKRKNRSMSGDKKLSKQNDQNNHDFNIRQLQRVQGQLLELRKRNRALSEQNQNIKRLEEQLIQAKKRNRIGNEQSKDVKRLQDQILQLKKRNRILNEENKVLKQLQFEIIELKKRNRFLNEENKDLKRLEDQLLEAKKQNRSLSSGGNQDLRQLESLEEQLLELRKRNRILSIENQDLKQLQQQILDVKKRNRILNDENQTLHQKLQNSEHLKQSNTNRKYEAQLSQTVSNQKQIIHHFETLLNEKDIEITELKQDNTKMAMELNRIEVDSRRKQSNIKLTHNRLQSILKTKEEEEVEYVRKVAKLESTIKHQTEQLNLMERKLQDFNSLQQDFIRVDEQKNSLNKQLSNCNRDWALKYDNLNKQKQIEINDLIREINNVKKQMNGWLADSRNKDNDLRITNQKFEQLQKDRQQEEIDFNRKVNKLESLLKQKEYEIDDLKQKSKDFDKINLSLKQYKQLQKELLGKCEQLKKAKEDQYEQLTQDNDQLRSQIKKFLSESRKKDDLVKQLQSRIQTLNKNKEEDQKEFTRKITRLQTALKHKEQELKELQNAQKEEEKNSMIKHQLRNSEKDISLKYQAMLKQKETLTMELTEEINSLTNEIRKVQQDSRKREQNFKTQISTLGAEIRSKEDQEIEYIKKINKLETIAERKEDERVQMQQSFSEKIAKLESSANDKEKQISELNTETNRLNNEVRKLTTEVRKKDEQTKTVSNKLENLINTKNQEDLETAKKINKMQTTLKANEEQILELTRKLNQQNQDIRKQTTQITFRQNTETQLRTKLRSKEQELIEVNSKTHQLQQDLKKIEKQKKNIEDTFQKIKIELSKQIELNQKYAELAASNQKQLDSLTEELNQLKLQNVKLREENTNKQQTIQKMNADNKHKQQSLIKLTEDYLKPLEISKLQSFELKGVIENLEFQLKKYMNTLKTKDQIELNLTRQLEKQISFSTKVKSEVDQLTFQIKRTQKELDQLRILNLDTVKDLQQQIKLLKDDKIKSDKLLESKEAQIHESSLQAQVIQNEVQKIKSQLAYEKGVVAQSEQSYTKLNQQCVQLRKTLALHESSLQSINESLLISKGQIERFKKYKRDYQNVTSQQQETNQQLAELQDRIHNLTNQLQTKSNTIKDLEDKLQQESQDHIQREANLNSEIKKLKEQKNRQTNQMRQLQDRLKRYEDQISKTIDDNAKQKQFYNNVQKKSDTYLTLLQKQRNSKDQLLQQISKCKKELAAVRTQKDDLKKSLYQKTRQSEKLAELLKYTKEEVNELSPLNESLKNRNKNLEQENLNLKETLQNKESTLKELEALNTELVNTNAQFSKNQEEYANRIEQLQREIADQQNINDQYNPKYEALVTANKELDARNKQLADMLNKAIQRQAEEFKEKVLGDVAKNAGNIFGHLKDQQALTTNKKKKSIVLSQVKSIDESRNNASVKATSQIPIRQQPRPDPYKRMMSAKITDHKKRISQSAHKLVQLLQVQSKSGMNSLNDYQRINQKIESIQAQKSNLITKINSYAQKLRIL